VYTLSLTPTGFGEQPITLVPTNVVANVIS
jgi:hypothetical protein